MLDLPANVFDLTEWRNRRHVFRDRAHAGEVLADMLEGYRGSDALVLAIPAGGVPVAAVIARRLDLPLDVAVVSKITLPWNTEAGYGAVAFDGSACLNERLVAQLGLGKRQVQEGIAGTRAKVARRAARLRGARPLPPLAWRPVILVDDGLASGFTLRTAREALVRAGADRLIVAVPTAHRGSLQAVAATVETLYCPNIRRGSSFAVADAYEHWSDVEEEELIAIIEQAAAPPTAAKRE